MAFKPPGRIGLPEAPKPWPKDPQNPASWPSFPGGAWPKPGDTPATPATPVTPVTPPRDYAAEAKLLFPWIPDALVSVFAAAWAKYGDVALAMGALRADPLYEQYFPGNKREDGSLRASEGEYLATMEGYDRELGFYGLAGSDFTAKKIQAFQNGKSPDEVGADVGAVYLGIVTRGDSYRAYYAQKFGDGNLSDSALLGSALDGTRSPYEFQRQIQAAQIGGAAGMFGFDIARGEAERLQAFGLEDQAARQLYAQAAEQLPGLNALIDRFNDPEDDLSVEEFADALVIQDPSKIGVIQRLLARDRSQWSQGGTFSAVGAGGGQRGLLAR